MKVCLMREHKPKSRMKTYLCLNCMWQDTLKKIPMRCPECERQQLVEVTK